MMKNDNKKVLAGIILFGSLWGFSESIIGSALKTAELPYGMLMTGVFAIPLLILSRILYRKPGAQTGIGMVAGGLSFFNPWIGCSICSAIAIAAEGMIFEILISKTSFDLSDLNLTSKASLGITAAFCIYVGGYIVTQFLTPLTYGGFYLSNLISFIPNILSKGLPVALIGGVTAPVALSVKKLDITIKDRVYYPTTLSVSAICWITVLTSWFLVAA
ncbi:MAG: hypothetical protein V5A64_03280 [Candidatus Thermoplasmatota archaeon]